MTWAELKQEVIDLLSCDGERERHQSFFEKQIRFGALDLQSIISAYKVGHKSTVIEDDTTADGQSIILGTLPEGAEVKAVWIKKPHTGDEDETDCEREQNTIKAKWHPWDKRSDFVCGNVPADTEARYAFNKRTREMHVFPVSLIEDGGSVIYQWDGKKLDFEDEDDVPFDEACINALYSFTRSQMLTMLDSEPTEGWKLMNTYEKQRTALYAASNK